MARLLTSVLPAGSESRELGWDNPHIAGGIITDPEI